MFHPELNYDIARMRQEELRGDAARRRVARAERPSLLSRWRRRTAETTLTATPAPRLVVVPPPRHDRDPTSHDERVA